MHSGRVNLLKLKSICNKLVFYLMHSSKFYIKKVLQNVCFTIYLNSSRTHRGLWENRCLSKQNIYWTNQLILINSNEDKVPVYWCFNSEGPWSEGKPIWLIWSGKCDLIRNSWLANWFSRVKSNFRFCLKSKDYCFFLLKSNFRF